MKEVFADGMPAPQRYWAYTAIIITLTLAVMGASVANVALPTIAHNFHATRADSISIVSAYQLAIVVSLMPLSTLGDIYGSLLDQFSPTECANYFKNAGYASS